MLANQMQMAYTRGNEGGGMPLSIGESVVVMTADGNVGYTGEVIGFEPGYYFDQPPAVLIAPDDERLEIPMKAPYHSVVTASDYMIPGE